MEDQRDDVLSTLPVQSVVEMAKGAEARINAIRAIKNMSLAVTNTHDWTNQQGKPYLQGSGAEKVAGLFNISWRIDEPRFDVEEDGHFTYTYRGVFSISGRSIEVDGSRSSKDPFFKKYDYINNVKTEKPLSAIDKRDVKMAAYTNCLANGITRLLGIRNLTWEDLKQFANIDMDQVQGVEYKKKGEKPPLTEPQKKTNEKSIQADSGVILSPIIKAETVEYAKKDKTGKPTGDKGKFYKITVNDENGNESALSTFSDSLYAEAKKDEGAGSIMKIGWKPGRKEGTRELTSVDRVEVPQEENAQ